MMRDCKHCGAQMDEQAKFCAKCGKEMEPTVDPTAQTPNEESLDLPENTSDTPVDTVPPAPDPVEAPDAEDVANAPREDTLEVPAEGEPVAEKAPIVLPGLIEELKEIPPAVPSAPGAIEDGFTLDSTSGKRPLPKFIIGGVAVLAVIVIAAVAIFTQSGGGGGGGSAEFYAAWDNTFDQIAAEFEESNEETGLSALMSSIEKKGPSQEFFLSVPIDYMGTIEFALTAQTNAALDQMFLSAQLGVYDTVETIAQFALKDDQLSLASPIFFTGVYSLDLGRLEAELASSALGRMMGVSQEDITELLQAFHASTDFYQRDYSLSDQTSRALERALETLKKSIDLPDGVSASVSVNGAKQDCSKYSFSISTEAAQSYLAACIEAFAADKNLASFIEEMSSLDPDTFYDYGNSQDMINEMRDELLTSLNDFMAQLDEIQFTGYISGDYLVRLELELTSQGATIPFVLELGSDRNLTDALTLTITSPDEEEIFTLSHVGSIVPKNGIVESKVSFSYSDSYFDDVKTMLDGQFRWDTKAASDNLTLSMTFPDDEFSFEMAGTLTVGKELFLDLTEVAFSSFYDSFAFPMTYRLYPTQEVERLSGEAKDLLSMSEEELQTLFLEIETAASNLGSLFW